MNQPKKMQEEKEVEITKGLNILGSFEMPIFYKEERTETGFKGTDIVEIEK